MPSYLADILASHRAQARDDRRSPDELAARAARAASLPATRDFAGALRGAGAGSTCIAEIKRRSPSKGDLDPDLQPDLVAKEYVAGGAS
jgi:indole-3-glycerol phosphate synthase